MGFALETDDEQAHAMGKLERKNLDFIVLNSLRNKGTCFRSDENQVCILTREGMTEYPKKSKEGVAEDIIGRLAEIM